jgi:DNA-binding transcriptional MerR regulator
MTGSDTEYTLTVLAGAAGVTPRTVRYYISQGLLPTPVGQGPGAHYTSAHLDRLRLIRRLADEHLPLARIRQELAALDDLEVAGLVAEAEVPQHADHVAGLQHPRLPRVAHPSSPLIAFGEPPAAGASSVAPPTASAAAGSAAIDYIRGVLGERRPSSLLRRAPTTQPQPAARFEPSRPDEFPLRDDATEPRPRDQPALFPSLPGRAPTPDRSTWERLSLTPDIELHVRRPLDRPTNKRLERLLEFARALFSER